MEVNDIESFIKYNCFHKEQKRSFENNGFHAQNLFYNAKEDYFVCTMGQHLEKQVLQSENKIMDIYLG